MKSALVLKCPMCNAVHTLKGQRNEYSKQDLYAQAKTHLRNHDLNETKAAIRKNEIVYDATEIVISSEMYQQLPIKAWMEPDDAWLPDDVMSENEGSQSEFESSVEISSH